MIQQRGTRWRVAEAGASDHNPVAGLDDAGGRTSCCGRHDLAPPPVTVLGIDCPAVVGSVGAIQPAAHARVSLRVPPGTDPDVAQDALIDHLRTVAPWHVQVEFQRDFAGAPFTGPVDGPAFQAMIDTMRTVYGKDVTLQGDGGSIPLCNVFQETFPDAEIMLLGVEEPLCCIHGSNESVDPTEIENMALVEAQFLTECARRLIRIE